MAQVHQANGLAIHDRVFSGKKLNMWGGVGASGACFPKLLILVLAISGNTDQNVWSATRTARCEVHLST
jgi:hypothetical protein